MKNNNHLKKITYLREILYLLGLLLVVAVVVFFATHRSEEKVESTPPVAEIEITVDSSVSRNSSDMDSTTDELSEAKNLEIKERTPGVSVSESGLGENEGAK